MSAEQAASISAQLNREGVAVSSARDGASADRYQLEVASTAVAAAVAVLARPAAEPARTRELPLIPSRAAEQQLREDELSARLSREVAALPGVLAATVSVGLRTAPDRLEDLQMPRPAPVPSARVILTREAKGDAAGEHARRLIEAALPGIGPSALTVVENVQREPPAACAKLAHIGPVTLTAESLGTLQLWLGVSMLVNMSCATALLAVLWRAQRRRRAAGARAPDQRSGG